MPPQIVAQPHGYRATCASGHIDFERAGPGRYLILLNMQEGHGNAALSFLRDAYAWMFAHTDCLVIEAHIDRASTYSRQLGRQIMSGHIESEDAARAVFKWSYGAHCRARGETPDWAAKRALRSEAIAPAGDGGRAAVIDPATGRVINLIVANVAVDTVPGCILVDMPDIPLQWARYLWDGSALVPDADLQAELDVTWAAAEREAG